MNPKKELLWGLWVNLNRILGLCPEVLQPHTRPARVFLSYCDEFVSEFCHYGS